jgi:hypothetical protein
MRWLTVFVSLVALPFAGCATVVDVPLAGGAVGHAISCDDPAPGWPVCIKAAGEMCNSAQYRIINQAEQPEVRNIPATQASSFKIGRTVINAPAQAASQQTIIHRTMVISCS